MPYDLSKYPENWHLISLRIKEEANWRCEKCKRRGKMPHEPYETQRKTLTIAHINHNEDDCREENLVCLCSPCHIAYDAQRKALQTLAKSRIKRSNRLQKRLEKNENGPAFVPRPGPWQVSHADDLGRGEEL